MSEQTVPHQVRNLENAISAQEQLRGTLPDAQIEANIKSLQQKMAELQAQLTDTLGTHYQAKIKGRGTIAQGSSTAVGERGVNVGGNVGGGILTGDRNKLTEVSGDYIGSDKIAGDKTTVGDISDSTGVAIGRGAQSHIQSGISGEELKALFQTIQQKVQERPEDPNVDKAEIAAQVQMIEAETTQDAAPNESKLERWIKNLANMAPDIVDVMAASLAGPVSGATAVLRKVINRVNQQA